MQIKIIFQKSKEIKENTQNYMEEFYKESQKLLIFFNIKCEICLLIFRLFGGGSNNSYFIWFI